MDKYVIEIEKGVARLIAFRWRCPEDWAANLDQAILKYADLAAQLRAASHCGARSGVRVL